MGILKPSELAAEYRPAEVGALAAEPRRAEEGALLRGTHPLEVCQEVIARRLHPEEVDVDTGDRILPLVLDDQHHLLTWIRLYSRCLAARNLFLVGAVDRCRWEIGAALVAAADTPCYLDEVYLAELRDLLRAADHALLAGETTIQHHGPYVALTMAENLCVTRMIRREAVSASVGHRRGGCARRA